MANEGEGDEKEKPELDLFCENIPLENAFLFVVGGAGVAPVLNFFNAMS